MNRKIRKSEAHSRDEARRLLGSLFAGEVARPGSCIWVIAPWISDIPVLDNTAATFAPLNPVGVRMLTLSEVLVYLGTQGTTVVIGMSDEPTNAGFKRRLEGGFRLHGIEHRLRITVDYDRLMHEKAIVADDFVLDGSMNFTFNGIELRGESLELHTDEEFVRQARMDAQERFGGSVRERGAPQ